MGGDGEEVGTCVKGTTKNVLVRGKPCMVVGVRCGAERLVRLGEGGGGRKWVTV